MTGAESEKEEKGIWKMLIYFRVNKYCRENIAEKLSKEGTCTQEMMARPKRGPSAGACMQSPGPRPQS